MAEAELAARATNALETRIKNAAFPVAKDFDTFDFAAMPTLSKPKVLELALCEWIDQKFNCCFVGNTGTGKTHLATGLGLAACRRGLRVRFFTAAALVSKLEQAQKHSCHGAFTGAGFTYQAEGFTGKDGERDIVHNTRDPAIPWVILGQAARLDERLRDLRRIDMRHVAGSRHSRNGSIPRGAVRVEQVRHTTEDQESRCYVG